MTNLLELKDVILIRSKKLSPLSVAIKSGEFWGILGRNGQGKTTLLHTLAGLTKPFSGAVFFRQQPIQALSRKQVARGIGLLLQEELSQFPITVSDAIRCAGYPHNNWHQTEKLQELLHLFNLSPYAHQSVLRLSGGEKRRMGIARILFQQPELYLLDEPTQQLDLVYETLVFEHFYHLAKQGKAIMMSGHKPYLMEEFCSHFLFLNEDGSVLFGRKETVFTRKNLMAVYGEH